MSKKERKVQLVLPDHIRVELESFLSNSSRDGREALAFLLCGRHKRSRLLRLLTRHLVLPEDDCFKQRTGASIRCNSSLDNFVLRKADQEELTIVTLHTHPHDGQPDFSLIDDRAEQERAEAINRALGNRVSLASVVYDRSAQHLQARLWSTESSSARPVDMRVVTTLTDSLGDPMGEIDPRFDRQVRAFGTVFQSALRNIRIGIVGVGGLGAMLVELLARLGVRRWVLVDPDRVAMSNLNRLTGATRWDAIDRKCKVEVALRNIRAIHDRAAEVRVVIKELPSPKAARLLASCDMLVGATDNHHSRLLLQEIGSAYLRPVINVGAGLVTHNGSVKQIAVRVTAPPVGGSWCLVCGGIVDPFEASKETSDEQHRMLLKSRGYLPNTPQPAVYWVNGTAANLAVRLVHSLVFPFAHEEVATDLYVDLYNPEFLPIDHQMTDSDCLVCGPDGSGLRGIGDRYLNSQVASLENLELNNLSESSAETAETSEEPECEECDVDEVQENYGQVDSEQMRSNSACRDEEVNLIEALKHMYHPPTCNRRH